MKTAKQFDDRCEPLVHLLIVQTLNELLEGLVRVLGDEMRRQIVFIHKSLEALVAGLFERQIVGEALADHQVDLLLEVQQRLREFYWVLLDGIVVVEAATDLFDVLLHAANDDAQVLRLPLVALVKQLQLLSPLVGYHVPAPCLLVHDRVPHIRNQLCHDRA